MKELSVLTRLLKLQTRQLANQSQRTKCKQLRMFYQNIHQHLKMFMINHDKSVMERVVRRTRKMLILHLWFLFSQKLQVKSFCTERCLWKIWVVQCHLSQPWNQIIQIVISGIVYGYLQKQMDGPSKRFTLSANRLHHLTFLDRWSV